MEMEELWKEAGILIRYVKKVKALGVGLGAGVRRNVDVAKQRLKTMKKRVPRFRRLRKLGVSTSRLLRTRALAAMTYGQAILGVSNSLLRDQRRTAATIAAPASGNGGQDLDLALTLADECQGWCGPCVRCPHHAYRRLGYSSVGTVDA